MNESCVYLLTYVYSHTYVYIYTRTRIHICVTFIHTHVYIYINTHPHTCAHTYLLPVMKVSRLFWLAKDKSESTSSQNHETTGDAAE
jgi:hypothetical protein